MAFLKVVGSIVLGGGIGYGVLRIISPDESELIKYLPPHSSQQSSSLFRIYKRQPGEYMSEDKLNKNFKNNQPEDSTKVIEK